MRPGVDNGIVESIILENRAEISVATQAASFFGSIELYNYLVATSEGIEKAYLLRSKLHALDEDSLRNPEFDLAVPVSYFDSLIIVINSAAQLKKTLSKTNGIDSLLAKKMIEDYWKDVGINN